MAGGQIGAQGHVGIGFEATPGTYAAPTKWFPVSNESLKLNNANERRRVIRGIADSAGTTPGDTDISGDINMEVLTDVLPYFLYAGRYDIVKTGSGPYEYAATGAHFSCVPDGRTLSIHVIRSGIVFAYTGCVVGGLEFTVENGKMMVRANIVGLDEAVQTIGTPAYSNQEPFGKGTYTLTVGGSGVTDIDTFTFGVADNATPAHRLKNSRSPEFVHFGERASTTRIARDFSARTEYDAFKALTNTALSIQGSHSASDQVLLEMPQCVFNTYELPLSAQGDLVRAAIDMEADYHAATGSAVKITVDTPTENVVTA